MLETLWGLQLRVPFELGMPVLARNGPDSGFATAIHGSSVIRASSSELMGEKRSLRRGEWIKHVPRPQAAEIDVDRRKLVNTSCQGEQLRLAPIEVLSVREEAVAPVEEEEERKKRRN
ncbi:hypothetical protein JCGZ_15556 [Jatropha curcas]|uniref:Uncharacterized protein n=1 Tax=Jatropha curcas TaxID=180498 RepID=A0A067K382_JATCU|nr:hypothetical protein JCGZ_15556 [Jatropha curcas]